MAYYYIRVRRGTAASATSNNPTLKLGEVGYETDTRKLKVGDDATAWTSLGYVAIPQGSATAQGQLELATNAEAVTGTDTERAVTPANLVAKMAAPGAIGGTTPAAVAATTLTASTSLQVGGGATITKILTGTATFDFGNIVAGTTSTTTITVTGVTTANTVGVLISASGSENITYTGRVTSADTVTVYAANVTAGAIDPASQTLRAMVLVV